MKYGVLFSLIAILLTVYAATAGGWLLLLIWPAISFGAVASAYFGLGPRVFGKRPNGTLSLISIVTLLPYFLYLWAIWHAMRLVSREPAFNTLTDSVLIGRRLLFRELPEDVDVVVDLTCEFVEPRGVRLAGRYISCPILDASSIDPRALAELAHDLASINARMFIHCAQGHGRTGLVAALFLIATKQAQSVDDAVAAVKSVRPHVGLTDPQMEALKHAAEIVSPENSRQQ